MNPITNQEQLIKNINSVENYFIEGTEVEKKIISDLIRKGKCLVAYKVNGENRFAPSRFLGYLNNTIKKHLNSREDKDIDGKETNVLISKVIKGKLLTDKILEKNYIKYCKNLGVEPSKYSKRKYWYLELENDFIENLEVDGLFKEGKIAERIHRSRERSSKVIEIAKKNFILKYGHLSCQVCGFDFEKKYGKLGSGFIEAHHTIPVSIMLENHKTSPNDIALLCANCHRMVHKKRPWLTMNKLTSLIK